MAEPFDASHLTHGEADVGDGVRLHYVSAGEGPLVLLLHGFPESWYAWRHRIPALAAAGLRVVAPDLRGYGTSDKPRRVRDYAPEILARDVARLVHALGAERAAVVGHDWGGGVAWLAAMQHPEEVERLAVLNCPHPGRLLRALTDPAQLRRSWYMFFFQLPGLPERLLRARGHAAIRRILLREATHPEAFTPEDIERYVEAAARPGALTGGVNYYRAILRTNPWRLQRTFRPVVAPTLVIWGERDSALGPELAEPDPGWVRDLWVERIPEAAHFVQADAPDRVNALLLDFLGGAPPNR